MVHLGFGSSLKEPRAARPAPHVQRIQTMLIATGAAWVGIVVLAGMILSVMV